MFEFIIYFICIVFAISLIVRAFSNISKNASRGDPIGTQYSKDDTYSYKPRVYGNFSTSISQNRKRLH